MHNPTATVANRFHELCSTGKFEDAMRELYADSARHVEAMSMPGCPSVSEGKAKLLAMAEAWNRSTTIHSASVGKPLVNGDQFACEMTIDCTSSEGPMAGQRHKMHEICIYTVKDGRITEGKFFYAM